MEVIHIKNAEAFQELEALSEKLRADSARLNKAVRWLEHRLKNLCLGVSVSVPLSDSSSGTAQELRYCKDDTGNTWALRVFSEDKLVCRLSSASRKLRLEALRLTPEILVQMKQKSEELLEQLAAVVVPEGDLDEEDEA